MCVCARRLDTEQPLDDIGDINSPTSLSVRRATCAYGQSQFFFLFTRKLCRISKSNIDETPACVCDIRCAFWETNCDGEGETEAEAICKDEQPHNERIEKKETKNACVTYKFMLQKESNLSPSYVVVYMRVVQWLLWCDWRHIQHIIAQRVRWNYSTKNDMNLWHLLSDYGEQIVCGNVRMSSLALAVAVGVWCEPPQFVDTNDKLENISRSRRT